jgi:hypothetical protein
VKAEVEEEEAEVFRAATGADRVGEEESSEEEEEEQRGPTRMTILRKPENSRKIVKSLNWTTNVWL